MIYKKYRTLRGNHIVNSETKIWIRDLIDLLESREPQTINNSDINWLGCFGRTLEQRIQQKTNDRQRFQNADITVPGIVVKNPTPEEKYRMLDGTHRMAKMHLSGVQESKQYVITKDEYESFFRDRKTGMPLKEKGVSLKEQKSIHGFPVCVYRYNDHEKNVNEIIKETSSQFEPRKTPHTQRTSAEKQLFDTDNEALSELHMAMREAYHHFYTQVLQCQHFHDFKVTQSWGIEVNGGGNMHFHSHFMSSVCSVYYPKYNPEHGGEILLKNPYDSNPGQLQILLQLGAIIDVVESVPVEEGDIVVFCGHVPHGVSPYHGQDSRISIATNSIPIPLVGAGGEQAKYLFDVSVYE